MTKHTIPIPVDDPLSTPNMAAECVTRDAKGRVTSTTAIAIPAGLTHDEAVAFVRRWNSHEIAQFVTYSA
jgi:hypothetical protein